MIPTNMIPPNQAQESETQKLDWLAFCYLCDELDEPTLTDFELLLANHLPAQQALARAVELYATSHLALATHTSSAAGKTDPPTTVPLEVRVAQRRRMLVALASTACAVICLVGTLFLPDNHSRDLPGNQPPANGPFLTDANSATETNQQAADLLTSWTELAAVSQSPADSLPNLAAMTNPDQTLTGVAPEQSADIEGDAEHAAHLNELATEETVIEELTTDELTTDELTAEQSAVPDWLLTAVAVASASEATYPAGLQELPN